MGSPTTKARLWLGEDLTEIEHWYWREGKWLGSGVAFARLTRGTVFILKSDRQDSQDRPKRKPGLVQACYTGRDLAKPKPKPRRKPKPKLGPVCTRCNDTHQAVFAIAGGEDQIWSCTSCPSPCAKCRRNGNGAYCTNTPCSCTCHGPGGSTRSRVSGSKTRGAR